MTSSSLDIALPVSMSYGMVAVAIAALSHGLFATFIVGANSIGAGLYTIGYVNGRPGFDRLARLIAFVLVLMIAVVSFLGVLLIFALNLYWPRFWHDIFNTKFWFFLFEAGFFLIEVVCVYAWFFLWSWTSAPDWRRPTHLALVWIGAIAAIIAMWMIDNTGSYMLTPGRSETIWDKLFPPTFLHLTTHRFFGNLAWAGFGLAGLCGIAWLRARQASDQTYYHWAGQICFAIGFAALLVMPIFGYHYLLKIRYQEPQIFYQLMLGQRSWLFSMVALVQGLLVVVGSLYIARHVLAHAPAESSSRTFLPVSLMLLAVAAVIFGLPYHLQHVPGISMLTDREILPWGKMQPHKYIAGGALVVFGMVNWVYYVRWFRSRQPGARGSTPAASLLIVLAILSIVMYLAMGWVRETGRAMDGYLVYGKTRIHDEAPTYRRAPPP
jgi:cytochrome bd ubiquinol oxidase subunit I